MEYHITFYKDSQSREKNAGQNELRRMSNMPGMA
jgi:hypothetical protein